MTGDDLVVERRVAAPAEKVFAYFTDAERWMAWQGTEAEIDLVPGGIWRVNVTGDGFASGRVVEVVENERVVFTWGWEPPVASASGQGQRPVASASGQGQRPVAWASGQGQQQPGPSLRPGSTTVTIELLPEGDTTLIRLTHSGLPPDLKAVHGHGWEHYVSRLAALCEDRDPGPNTPGG